MEIKILNEPEPYFKDNFITLVNFNTYYPFYALKHSKGIPGYQNITDIRSYKRVKSVQHRCNAIRHYIDLYDVLENKTYGYKYVFTSEDQEYRLGLSQYCIMDQQDKILFLLCVKDLDLPVIDNPSNLILLVATEFEQNEIYKNIYKKIYSYFIRSCFNQNIDVMFLSSDKIEKQVFNDDFNVEFDNITELNTHLEQDVHKLFDFSPSTMLEEFVSSNDTDSSTLVINNIRSRNVYETYDWNTLS